MRHLNLFIQSVIMFNGWAVLSTQYLIMLKGYICCYVKKFGYPVYETCEQTVILFNARVVLFTQFLIMLKDYVIMLNTYVVFST